MTEWVEQLASALKNGNAAVLVSVIEVRGSAPREAGAKMVVEEETFSGTIGGGNLEFEAIAIARRLLAEGAATVPVVHDFQLGPDLGQCCGGHVRLLLEVLRPETTQVAVFGAGHVGRALVRILADLPWRIRWIDPRPDAFPEILSRNVAMRVRDDAEAEIDGLAAGTLVAVMTMSHDLDYRIVFRALGRPDLPYVGLIGSATKRARFVHRFARAGLAGAAEARLVCPIGRALFGDKHPQAIAIAAAAELLAACAALTQPGRHEKTGEAERATVAIPVAEPGT